MSELQKFSFQGFEVRTIFADGETWFVLNDLCRVLEVANPRSAASRVNPQDKGVRSVDTLGGQQNMTVVNESGMYDVVLESRKPHARAFRRWVTSEVLPEIRRTGSYSQQVTPMSGTELMAAAVVEAQKVLAQREERIRELEPKAAAWANLASVGGDLSVAEAAKVLSRDPDISIGRQRLFDYMEDIGWIFRTGRGRRAHWEPYQRHVDNGRLVAKFGKPFFNSKTEEWEQAAPTLRITPKGIEALRDRLSVGSQLAII
ncbi:BRO family protein [Corynebacterium sp. H127]|uniref:BRO family protein n=1 Tax=Corynebacterium sp. H127 TaxID=3133418 RepID=UPI00309E1649